MRRVPVLSSVVLFCKTQRNAAPTTEEFSKSIVRLERSHRENLAEFRFLSFDACRLY
jgi:hypothetical protein